MKYYHYVLVLILMSSCLNNRTEKPKGAQAIVARSMEASGSRVVDTSEISFVFRDMRYRANRNEGLFTLSREQIKDGDTLYDEFNNDRFQRKINGAAIKLEDSMVEKYRNSINSVHYFSVLPYGLDASAVILKYIDSVELKNQTYHKIQVTFSEDGGGEDFEDVFLYWIHQDSFYVDYLAYSYHTNEGGLRFREAYNARVISGIRFVDYNNYKPKQDGIQLEDLGKAFVEGELELLSKIELQSISVN